jgi:CheY-like chemotaxis protein
MSIATLLLADDDDRLRRGIALRLRADGFDVVEAADGAETLKLARTHRPDMLILDVHMPAGDGLTVLDRLDASEELGALPVIYISGDHAPWLHAAVEKRGAAALVRKPFTAGDLIEAVRLLMGELPTAR